jgi:hypothetical protein
MNEPCPDWSESIDLHAAGWLDAAADEALRAHLAVCPACRAACQEAVALTEDLRAITPALRSPRLPPKTGFSLRRAGWFLAAAAALMLVVLRPAREPVPEPFPVAARDAASIPTWLACNHALEEEGGLESLLDRHEAGLSLGKPVPVLLAFCTAETLEEIR